jgi:hypothetical protein
VRTTSPTNRPRPTLAAVLLLGFVAACGKQPDAPQAAPATPDAPSVATDDDEAKLERWRRDGDADALTALWRAQVQAESAEKWAPLLQSTAFGLSRLRGGKTQPALRDALATFASSEGIAQHRRIDPRLVLPVAELLWDQRDAAAVLRLAETFGKPPHEQGYRFLRSAADEVASKQPALLTLAATCPALLDGKPAAGATPLNIAPGSHSVGCSGTAPRLLRVGPGESAQVTLP